MHRINGKRVLITGAAQGIGLALARAMVDEGAHVLLTDCDDGRAGDAAQSLARRGSCVAYKLDVTDREALAELRDRLLREQGPLDVLVNNAGVVYPGAFLEIPWECHRRTLEVNLKGLMATTYMFLPQLMTRPVAHLVNMASASGLTGLPQAATYSSTKWAVVGFSESLRGELKGQGLGRVSVTTVCPAYVDTSMFRGVRPPPWIPFLNADRLARKVVLAVRRGRPMVLEPWLVKMVPLLMATLPRSLTDHLSKCLGVTRSLNECHPCMDAVQREGGG